MSASFCEAIHYTLELASSHPVFDDLLDEAFRTPLTPQGKPPPFVPGSQSALFAWKPQWWSIPSDEDLALEAYLTDPNIQDRMGDVDWLEPLAPVAWYFSAAAVAVDFLSRLRREQRMRIREKIIIREDMRGAAHPECHASGLIPCCIENPKLRIEVHMGVWNSLMPPIWLEYQFWDYDVPTGIGAHRFLRSFADWIGESLSLFSSGMPVGALRFILEGSEKETLQVWTMIKHAAGLQETLIQSVQVQQHGEISLGIIRNEWNLTCERDSLLKRFQLPCDLPVSFCEAIKQIVAGTSIIQFNGDPGGLWNSREMNMTRRYWSPQDFYNEWSSLSATSVSLPTGDVRFFFKKYELQALLREQIF